ncbi:Nif3-like dinuclear metal center hexameric protein, partial [Solicola sp. PLA-1-18]|uniref:Nif3-like dinuclear metal center hexameric protein n=1 Tax=Solicola sp. PLA-1-18 TaxID=3380532 RepID=UPI003B7F0547
RDVVAVLDAQWNPAWADDWDAVGTSVGDLDAPVRKVLLAVDPTLEVVEEAVEWGADLLLTHHPLLLKGVHGVSTGTPKGRIVHRLISGGVALHTCHTNADSPPGGVSASMADALGLVDVRPLDPDPADALDKWVVMVPADDADRVAEALLDAGAGHVGDYDRCTFVTAGIGTFRPLEGADPTIGQVGEVENVAEDRVEMVAQPHLRERLLAVLREVHPYEEVAFDLLEMAPRPGDRGSGRIGTLLEPVTLADFAADVVASLPPTSSVARVAGDPEREVRTVALCGGSGDFLLEHARRAGADVYVTSDLRHHPVSEAQEQAGAPAVVDVPHWAAEWTWLPNAARLLSEALAEAGSRVETRVSRIVTDPWTTHVAWPAEATTPRRPAP